MAKKSSVEKNERRKRLVAQYAERRAALKLIIKNKATSPEDRFKAQMKLDALPRNSSAVRVRNRCWMTGRARGYYRRFGLSRIAFRELASDGQVPGIVKASW